MNLKHLISRQTFNNLSKLKGIRFLSSHPSLHRNATISTSSVTPNRDASTHPKTPNFRKIDSFGGIRSIHTAQDTLSESENNESEDDDVTMNEFLSRFVWIMRGKIVDSYPDIEKKTIDEMLLIIVSKVVSEIEKGGLEQTLGSGSNGPSQDFSEDLWKTVWEVSNVVLEDMDKARKKEKMKNFLQSEEVKEMCRFAGEVGIRGEMLRELRFKWAREKMEESEFYKDLERLREEGSKAQDQEQGIRALEEGSVGDNASDVKPDVVSLPKRHGKINYKIYGLDLSDPKWSEVADKIHEAEEIILPQEPKPITGKCKLVTEKILSLQEKADPSPLLAEWVQLLQPSRIDWINLLDRLKELNARLYMKIAELVLGEESFQTTVRDYSKLIDAHARDNCLEDAERILQKMKDNGVVPDILTSTTMVYMYCKAGNLVQAKLAFESLRDLGFQPDMKAYNSMIFAYVNAGEPKLGESLMREMEARDIKPSKDIYMALLRSFAQRGDVNGAQRIANTMQFAGFQPDLESCSLLIETFEKAGDPDQARNNFDYMIKLGHKPDDRSTASMIAAYMKKNLLDKALNLLLELEKDGFEPGVATYSVLVDWLGRLQLIDEAEQVLDKIARLGEAPPLKVHVSLCDMYAKAGAEKKALQALGVLEAKKDQLGAEEFERIINALVDGGFKHDARKFKELMDARGFVASEGLKVAIDASQAFRHVR